MNSANPDRPVNRTPRPVALERVPDQLIIGNRQAFKERCLRHLEAKKHLVVDFHDARYLDSAGLGVLVSLQKRFAEAGLCLVVCGLNSDLATLWELTRMDSVLRPYSDAVAAERALQAA